MPIVKCAASKATPAKGIDYIMDPEKVIAKGSQGFVTGDPKKMARQMLQTMHLFGKGFDPDERKYYHAKVAFDPADRPENGGSLDPRTANAFAAEYAKKIWPGREVVWAVQDHGASIHIHFIAAACEQETGKKLDARDAEYRAWKDQAQDLAKQYGLSTLDWRKATREKRGQEIQSSLPIDETFAEQGMKARGKDTWKDDLRERIDAAVKQSRTMDEFKAQLQARGVELTRCTEKTISYRLEGREKGCRGDTLGGDYTVAAIQDALQHNSIEPAPEQGKAHAGLAAMIGRAEQKRDIQIDGGRVIGQEERAMYRELGRLAGVKRSEIDALCDTAEKATWDEKQKAWDDWKVAKADFWAEYEVHKLALQKAVDDAYKRRRKIKAAEWAIDPRNRRKSLFGVIYAGIVLAKNDTRFMIEREIQTLKQEQQQLRRDMAAFKSHTGEARETLREKGLSLDAYMASVERMQAIAGKIQRENAALLDVKDIERLRREIQRNKQKQKSKSGPEGR